MKFLFYTIIFSFLFLNYFSSCSVNKAKIDNDLKKFFDSSKIDGCFAMFNNATGSIKLYNMKLDTQRFLPAHTFEIVDALIGLETDRISDEKMLIKFDSVTSLNKNFNSNLNMAEAFKASSSPYFQEVAKRIGKDILNKWIDTLNYGNMNLSGQIDSFWLDNTLKISPDEQLGLVKRLYFDQLPFQKRSQQIVRDAMLHEDNTAYKFSFKTGEGQDENVSKIGWTVGWIEENRHVYFFVTLVKNGKSDPAGTSLKISKNILTSLGFFKGEM